MFNLETLPEKALAFLIYSIAILLLGVFLEHERFAAYKNVQKGEGIAQEIITKQVDKQNKENANVSENDLLTSLQSVHDYYRRNPVVRVRNTCSSTTPKTDNYSLGAHDSPALGYVTPYSPDATETVAVRLDTLQKLLIKDGVKIK